MEIIGETMYLVGLATSKATVATFLLRIVAKTWHKLVLYFIIISTAIVCFFCALFNYVQCSPVAHVWNPTIPATCWMSVEPLAVFTGGEFVRPYTRPKLTLPAWGAAVDFALVILPWLILARLQMERKKKLVILFSMSLGIFAGICGIIRSVAVQGLSSATDYTYDTISLILWSSTEITFTVIAACIPAIRPLWRDITSVRGVSLSRSRKGTNSGRSKSERYQLGAFANDVYSGPEGSRATLNPQAVENVEARTRTTPLHTDDGIERIREVSVTYQYNNRDSSMAEVV